ncbi:MAG: peptidylprolyl isomerase [Betaproteobacteria bacterium]
MTNLSKANIALTCAALALALALAGMPAGAQVTTTPSPPMTGGAAQPADPGTELLRTATVRLTRGDYDTELSRLPEDTRGGFGTNIDRINTLLRVMLVDKSLAHEARDAGLDKDPEIARIISAETDRILSKALMDRNQAQWEKEANARPNLDQAARERWLSQPDKFRKGDEMKLQQIFYAFPKHSVADAKSLAQAARAKIAAGASMDDIAKAESDDAASAQNGGHVDWRAARDMDPQLARVAFGLRKPGDLSRPIETESGIYLVRLDAKRVGDVRAYEDVKASILADLRREYVDAKRAQRMAAIRNDPAIVVNQPAVNALVVRIDPEILKKATETPAVPGGKSKRVAPAAN